MYKKFFIAFFACILCFSGFAEDSLYQFKAKSIDGKNIDLSQYKGKVLLLVNTASKCGFTPQYKDLQDLYTSYADRGFSVLGFPSNDFGGQEPGSDKDIKKFCSFTYGVTFPLFTKGSVAGKEKQPVFKWLTEEQANNLNGEVDWNFEKFLIDKHGKLRARFGSQVNPASRRISAKIDELVAESG